MRPAITLAALGGVVALGAVGAASGGCERGGRAPAEVRREPERQRRVIEPPVGIVRALPPHAIRADGVGPYRLGERLASVLDQLPGGPRIALFEIPGLLHRSLIRAEDDTLLVAGEPGGLISMVAVVGSEVARTASGIHVGSPRAELERVLGPHSVDPGRALDPRVYVPAELPHARIILDDDRIGALVITGTSAAPRAPLDAVDAGPPDPGCARPAPRGGALGACLTAAGELVTVDGQAISARAAGTERALPTVQVAAPIVFAAPLRADGRDELAVVTRSVDAEGGRTWWLSLYRVQGGKLVVGLEAQRLYELTAANAAWIGAELSQIELFLELVARPDAIEIGGLLTSRSDAQGPPRWRDVLAISPVSIPRRPGPRPAGADPAPPPDAGRAADAGLPVDARQPVDAPGGHASDPAAPAPTPP